MVKVFRPKTSIRKRKRGTQYTWKKKNRRLSDESRYSGAIVGLGSSFGFPQKMRTKLRYCDTITFDGSSAVGTNTFRMNSLYDPDLSGVGHQPTWFDQICNAAGSAPYGRYRVLGSKLTVTFSNSTAPATAALNTSPELVFIEPSTASTAAYTSTSSLMECSSNKWAVLQAKEGGNNSKTLSVTYSPQRDLGLSSGDDTVTGGYNSNPSNSFYAHIGKRSQNTYAGSVIAFVQIEYFVEFYLRNEVNTS